MKKFLVQLREYLITNKPQFVEIVRSTKIFTEQAENILKEAIKEHTELSLLQEDK